MSGLSSSSKLWLFASLALWVATDAVANPVELPMRKAGLWQLTTVMDEGAGPREHAFKMCIDASMEQNTVHASMIEHQSNCSTYDVKTADGMTTVNADCVFNSASVQSRTEMKGDFKTSFEIDIESTTLAKQGAQSRPIKRTIKQTGNYIGESCGDVGPGEALTPEGDKFVVQ